LLFQLFQMIRKGAESSPEHVFVCV
jgi:hypothetical protein